MVTDEWASMACLYCPWPVLNGHLLQNHLTKLGMISQNLIHVLSSIFERIFVP